MHSVEKVSGYMIKIRLRRISRGLLISFVLLLTMQHMSMKVTVEEMAYNDQAEFRHSDITSSIGDAL